MFQLFWSLQLLIHQERNEVHMVVHMVVDMVVVAVVEMVQCFNSFGLCSS